MKKKLRYVAPEAEIVRLYHRECIMDMSVPETTEGGGDGTDRSREDNNGWLDTFKQEGEFDKEW